MKKKLGNLKIVENHWHFFSKIYLKAEFLETLIRKPSNLRTWTNSKMSSFSKEALPDDELKDLISYLIYMAKHKVPIGK